VDCYKPRVHVTEARQTLRNNGTKYLELQKRALNDAVHSFEIDNKGEKVESALMRTNWLLNHMKAVIENILEEPEAELVLQVRTLTHKSHVFTPDILQNVSTSLNVHELYGPNDSVQRLKEAFIEYVLFMNKYLNLYANVFFLYKVDSQDELVEATNERYKEGLVFLKEVFEKLKMTVRQLTKRRGPFSSNFDPDSWPTTRYPTEDDQTHHYTPRMTTRSAYSDDSDSDDPDIRPTTRCRTDVNYVPFFPSKSTKRPATFDDDDDIRPTTRCHTDINYIPPFAPRGRKRPASSVQLDDDFYTNMSKCRIEQ